MNYAVAPEVGFDLHREKFAKYYAPGILNVERHLRLVEKLRYYSRVSCVPEHYIYNSKMSLVCSEDELNYVRHFHSQTDNGIAGLVYLGKFDKLEQRLLTMAAELIRNMINVRVIYVHELIEELKAGDPPDESVVLIPNFFMGVGAGSKIPEWQAGLLTGWLASRYAAAKQTVLYVSDPEECQSRYGDSVSNHIKNHYAKAFA